MKSRRHILANLCAIHIGTISKQVVANRSWQPENITTSTAHRKFCAVHPNPIIGIPDTLPPRIVCEFLHRFCLSHLGFDAQEANSRRSNCKHPLQTFPLRSHDYHLRRACRDIVFIFKSIVQAFSHYLLTHLDHHRRTSFRSIVKILFYIKRDIRLCQRSGYVELRRQRLPKFTARIRCVPERKHAHATRRPFIRALHAVVHDRHIVY